MGLSNDEENKIPSDAYLKDQLMYPEVLFTVLQNQLEIKHLKETRNSSDTKMFSFKLLLEENSGREIPESLRIGF